jgi:hypothetical protein
VNRSNNYSDCIEFKDARSARIHAELQVNDVDGRYASFFKEFTDQSLECPINTAIPSYKFTIESLLAVEVYSASDKIHIRQSLLQIARSMAKRDNQKFASLEAGIHKAMGNIKNGKKSRSFQHFAEFVVDAETDLFDSYTIRIESIGSLLIRIYFVIAPSTVLHNRITKISERQTNTRVRIMRSRLHWPFHRRSLSFSVEMGNMIKRAMIKELDNDTLNQVYGIVKRDIPGILARNYGGIPVIAIYRGNTIADLSNNSPSSTHATHSEFLRLVATSGVDDHDVYENPSTNDIYIEQKRRDSQNLRVLGVAPLRVV